VPDFVTHVEFEQYILLLFKACVAGGFWVGFIAGGWCKGDGGGAGQRRVGRPAGFVGSFKRINNRSASSTRYGGVWKMVQWHVVHFEKNY
jgi:hypothetical protein